MITEKEQPIWYPYVLYDDNFNPYLIPEAPEDAKKAFLEYQQMLDRKNREGEMIER